MIGIWVNPVVIVLGGLIGTLLRGGIPERLRSTVFQGLALCVMLIGVSGAIETQNVLAVIVSIVVGGIAGEALKLEERLDRLGDWAQSRFSKGDSSFSQGFVSATLLFCVGAMAVVGSLEAGLQDKPDTLLAKSAIDGVTALIFASTMGPGVMLAALPILLYQGGIALLSGVVGPWLPAEVIREMSATGSLLILGLGLNMLDAVPGRIKVGNLLPAMFVPIVYLPLSQFIASLIH